MELGADSAPRPRTATHTSNSPYGRPVTEVRFKPGVLVPFPLSLRTGDILTAEKLSQAMNEVAGELTRQAELTARAGGGDVLSIVYVDAEFDSRTLGNSTRGTVAVTLRPFQVTLPLDDPGRRVLPVPRGFGPVALASGKARSMLPTGFTFSHDRVLGTSAGGHWHFDANPDASHGNRGAGISVRAGGLKSLDSAFYAVDADVRATRHRASDVLRDLTAAFDVRSALEPRGAARYGSRAWGGRAGLTLAFNANSRVLLDSGYARAEHKFSEAGAAARWTRSNEQANRVVFEGIPSNVLGFFRAALWEENLAPRDRTPAHRVVARLGYAKEIPLASNQSIGVEVVGGAGQTWRGIEPARRFFAGGSQGEFLYEGASSPNLLTTPDGPLVRSLGRAQGGFRSASPTVIGGTRFWHLNVNIALPIPAWSRPLIPDETTDLPGPDRAPQTLKQILRAQIDRTGPNLLQSTLQSKDGLSPDEAKRRAAQVFDEIRPAARFVIDQANLFSVKPLLLFDAAELRSDARHEAWLAGGAGVQLTIVIAKFEGGYMRTLHGPTFGSRGNVFARLAFDRVF